MIDAEPHPRGDKVTTEKSTPNGKNTISSAVVEDPECAADGHPLLQRTEFTRF